MQFEAKMIEDSISPAGIRLSTLQLRYPRFVHSEFMTHRVFSRNASSSRAIPVEKMIDMIEKAPAEPIHWGKNQSGMQAREELDFDAKYGCQIAWAAAANYAVMCARDMHRRGAHKQVVNRILEPFQWISVIVTATEWDNFFELRNHPDADPNIQLLARLMKQAMAESTPVERDERLQPTAYGWHLPYITPEERREYALCPLFLAQISAARCARVSYLTHDGAEPQISKDIELYERLVGSRPLHASPVEHQAYPMALPYPQAEFSGNFRGWRQHRKLIEAEMAN